MQTNDISTPLPPGRLLSLDAFRGATMMSMVLVNNPGSWDSVYPPLLHASWHGCTFTDLIFPFFLFIVGVSMAFSFAKRLQSSGGKKGLIVQIIRRSLIIVGLGMLLNLTLLISIPDAPFRIPGVLQRIALCYFAVSWMALYLKPRGQWTAAIALMLIYSMGMFLGCGSFEAKNNFCLTLDRIIWRGHVWPLSPAEGFDPEGIWSSLTAIVTTLIGYRAGSLLRSNAEEKDKLIGLFLHGSACLFFAYVSWAFMPVNKQLWTIPYVFLTAGLAMHVLAVFYYVIDLRKNRKYSFPALIYGSNAIFIYVGSGLAASILSWISIGQGESISNLWDWMYSSLFLRWADPINASLAMGLSYVLFWLLIAWMLYRKRIFLKI